MTPVSARTKRGNVRSWPIADGRPKAIEIGKRTLTPPWRRGAAWLIANVATPREALTSAPARYALSRRAEVPLTGSIDHEDSAPAPNQFWIFVIATPVMLIGLYVTRSNAPELPMISARSR